MPGEFTAIFANLSFAVSNVFFRKTEGKFSATFINAFRTTIGLLTFYIVALFLNILPRIFELSWQIWMILFISIIFGQVVGDTAYFIAQEYLGATKALAVSMTFPFFTFILSIIVFDRPFSYWILVAAILIVSGVLIMNKYRLQEQKQELKQENRLNVKLDIKNNNKSKHNKFSITLEQKAYIWAFLAAISWTFGIVLTDYVMKQIDTEINTGALTTIIGNCIRFPLASVILILLVLRENKRKSQDKFFIVSTQQWKNGSRKNAWTWLILASIIGTSLGAYLYAEAARTAGATFMALMSTACPIFAYPISYFLNKERISKLSFIGVFLTICGIILVLFIPS